MIHHQLVRQLTSSLCVLDLLVDQTVHDRNTAIDAESVRYLLVEIVEMLTVVLVAELRDSHNGIFVSDRKTKNVASFEAGSFIHAFVEKRVFVGIFDVKELTSGRYVS